MYKTEADQANPSFFASQIEDLCEWHLQDPVDAKEWARTHYIAQYQDNKPNPFVLDCTLAYRTYCGSHSLCTPLTSTENLPAWGLEQLKLYPNPFGQNTQIQYHLHQPLQVRLSVLDALGRELQLLYQGNQNAGEYQYEWDAQAFPSGLYWYKLQLGNAAETKVLTGKILKIED